MLNVQVDNSPCRRVVDDGVSIGVGSGASVKNNAGMVLLCLVGAIGDIGAELAGDVFFVDPEGADSRALHQ